MSAKKSKLDRRTFLSVAGATAGASVLLGQSPARADVSPTWPDAFDPKSTSPIYPPRDMPNAGEKVHEFRLEVTIATHEIVPGIETHMFVFNGMHPGPEIRVPEGEWVQVELVNKSPESHTIHWHGIFVPNEMDGVPNGTQWAVGPNETFRYLWRAQPTGTHFYHCHVMTSLHQTAGLVGSLIIEPADDVVKRTFNYDREYTLLLSEIDTNWVRDNLNAMVTMGMTMDTLNKNPRLMQEMSGRMMGWFKDKQAFLKAVKDGYVPPYATPMAGANRPITPNFFMINGKAYPMTDSVLIKTGETIRVRLIGGGIMPHYMHLHGHDFWHVCQDGAPLAAPVRLNTIPVNPGTTADIIIQGTNPGHWHFHDHSDVATSNNGMTPGGMMTMLMYEDAADYGIGFDDVIQLSS